MSTKNLEEAYQKALAAVAQKKAPETKVVCMYCRAEPLRVYGVGPGLRVRIPEHKNEVGYTCRGGGHMATVEMI